MMTTLVERYRGRSLLLGTLLLVTFILYAHSICEPLVNLIPTKAKNINVKSNLIEIISSTNIQIDKQPFISFSFNIPLKVKVDYDITLMKAENSVPAHINIGIKKHHNASLLGILLRPGKSWLLDLNATTNKELYLTNAVICSNENEFNSYKPTSNTNINLRIATFQTQQAHCPKIPKLHGASSELMLYITETLNICANLRIFKSRKLQSHHVNSFSLLSQNIGMVLVDAHDQSNLADAIRAVDAFLAPHSVLDVAWEPYSEDDPKWFVLLPKPRGMPGHLFAMLDWVQWDHPLVRSYRNPSLAPSLLENQCNGTNPAPGCVVGCPGSFISRMTGSGFGADSWHLMIDMRRGLFWNEPVQAAPFRFGHPKGGGPNWEGSLGWTYTYDGCSSNFLDCYFLDHSPCPKIAVDPYEVWKSNEERVRVRGWNTPNIGQMDREAFEKVEKEWWYQVFLPEQNDVNSDTYIPRDTIENHHGRPAEQVFFTYMWRPNYELRKEVHKRVNAFNLNEACAAMHVRRGDTVFHGGQSRAYISVESYVRAARPVMDALGIKTIMLFTDSGSAIAEALNCTQEYPDVCDGIKFRYVDKKRFYGAEGGWENHFPSGSPQQELYTIQTEFALANKCSMIITGQSSYGDKLRNQMCCGFPLRERGVLPKRCFCPPHVQVSTASFGSCADGNLLLCKNMTVDAKVFTSTKISRPANSAQYRGYGYDWHYKPGDTKEFITTKTSDFVNHTVKSMCRKYDRGPPIGKFCKQHGYII